MPLYIAPSFLKLFLLLYSGLGEVEGRERNRKGNSTKPCPPAVGPCPWPVAGPVLKPQHLECKMQFHSAAAPSAQRGPDKGLWAGKHWGNPEQSLLGQLPRGPRARQEPCWALNKALGFDGGVGGSCCAQSKDPSPACQPLGSHSSQGSGGEVLEGQDWGWKAALHQAGSAAPRGSTKLLIVWNNNSKDFFAYVVVQRTGANSLLGAVVAELPHDSWSAAVLLIFFISKVFLDL